MLKYTVVVLFAQLMRVECLYDGDSCNAEGRPGTCRPLSQCPPLVSEIRRAGSPMPLHLRKKLDSLNCGFVDREPMVCCPVSSNGGTDPSDKPSVPNRGGTETYDPNNNLGSEVNIEEFTRRSVTDNSVGPRDIQSHPNLRLLPTKCGNIENDKIWGGERTNLFEMPWMVLLSYHTGHGPTFSCGGTLINERYILTAAHCVSYLGGSLQLDGVILGEYDVRTDPDCIRIEGEETCAPRSRNATIEQAIPHPGYTPQTVMDDIALIRLAEPADFRLDSMKPICLPLSNALQTESLVGRNGVVAGWGVTEENLQSSVLLSVGLPIISTQDCNNMYKGARHITDKQICAGGVQEKDSCGGDSGGPLMYPGVLGRQGAQYVQRGVVSYGPKRCGVGGYPGVYTNVAYYMDWILDHIRA